MTVCELRRAISTVAALGILIPTGGCESEESARVRRYAEAEESVANGTERARYPAHWWEPVSDGESAWWEILPQAAGSGEVVLSKRNELGLLSNFAATPFVFRGKRYASLEGLWQSMKYPESDGDLRASDPESTWEYTRDEVMAMVAFEAKEAGDAAEKNMYAMGIDWVTFEGERMSYRGEDQGSFYRIIEAGMRAKMRQNPDVERVLLATGDLILRPDHVQEENAPAAWRYDEIWMKLRTEQKALKEAG